MLLITTSQQARDPEGTPHSLEGNLTLPASQQPSTLFAFGQNIVDAGDLIGYLDLFTAKGHRERYTAVVPNVLYGITDELSLFVRLPVAVQNRIDNFSSHGLQDASIQFEYAYHLKSAFDYANQATLVANITFPTGSVNKNPITGDGSVSFFVGTTASHLATTWNAYGSAGVEVATERHKTKIGTIIYYQGGIGGNIAYEYEKWILTIMLEVNGTYSKRNKIKGVIDENSGGNIFSIGPSLWFSTQNFDLQVGLLFPITQHLYGCQNRQYYGFGLSLGYKFNNPATPATPSYR
jgi:hypothetical protein